MQVKSFVWGGGGGGIKFYDIIALNNGRILATGTHNATQTTLASVCGYKRFGGRPSPPSESAFAVTPHFY